jgi:hypothetical protein
MHYIQLNFRKIWLKAFFSLLVYSVKSALDPSCRDPFKKRYVISSIWVRSIFRFPDTIKKLSGLMPRQWNAKFQWHWTLHVFSISVCEWKIWENYLQYFTLTLGAGMVELTVTTRWTAGVSLSIVIWSFLFVSISKQIHGCHPVSSPASTLPEVWNCHLP